jgi:Rrf2 family protein
MSEIFKASEAVNLAIHSMALLTNEVTKTSCVKELASIINSSSHHLSKVLLKLSKAGLVKSNRGPSGGFLLKRNPDEITIRDIYEAIEGKISVSKCFFKINSCDGTACLMGSLSRKISEQFEKVITETRLSDIKMNTDYLKKRNNDHIDKQI